MRVRMFKPQFAALVVAGKFTGWRKEFPKL